MMAVALVSLNSVSISASELRILEEGQLLGNDYVVDEEDYIEIENDADLEEIENDFMENVVGLTDEEILKMYYEYLSICPETAIETEEDVSKHLEGFAEYAVEQGVIENNVVQKTAVTKAVVRAEFKTVATAGKALGYKTAAAFLKHSLQDSPSNLSYASTTSYASQISKSSKCKKIVNDFKAYVKDKKLSSRTTSGSTTLNTSTDLKLAYNKVSYIARGTKKNGTWTLKITFSDTYDFDTISWKEAMKGDTAVAILNNYAAHAQSLKAIVPYKIKVTVTTTFKE